MGPETFEASGMEDTNIRSHQIKVLTNPYKHIQGQGPIMEAVSVQWAIKSLVLNFVPLHMHL